MIGDRDRPRQPTERASALLLFPAALLVVLVLAALAVDAAVAFGAQRALIDALGAAANDAVTVGLDEEHLRRTGEYRLDPIRVEATIVDSLSRRGILATLVDPVRWRIDGRRVVIDAVGWVDHVLTPVVPGAPTGRRIPASASAEAILRGG